MEPNTGAKEASATAPSIVPQLRFPETPKSASHPAASSNTLVLRNSKFHDSAFLSALLQSKRPFELDGCEVHEPPSWWQSAAWQCGVFGVGLAFGWAFAVISQRRFPQG